MGYRCYLPVLAELALVICMGPDRPKDSFISCPSLSNKEFYRPQRGLQTKQSAEFAVFCIIRVPLQENTVLNHAFWLRKLYFRAPLAQG